MGLYAGLIGGFVRCPAAGIHPWLYFDGMGHGGDRRTSAVGAFEGEYGQLFHDTADFCRTASSQFFGCSRTEAVWKSGGDFWYAGRKSIILQKWNEACSLTDFIPFFICAGLYGKKGSSWS